MNRMSEVVIPPKFETAEDFEDGRAVVGIIENGECRLGTIDTNGTGRIPPRFQSLTSAAEGMSAARRDDKWRYLDDQGHEIIPFQFEEAGPFSEGRAAVKLGGWVGFIDKKGTMIVRPQFTCSVSHSRFVDGMAPVFGADEKTGYIDREGNWKIPPKYGGINLFRNGLARMELGSAFSSRLVYINPKGETVWKE